MDDFAEVSKIVEAVQHINLQRIMNYQDMLAIFQNAGYMGLYGGLDVEKPFSFFAIVDSEYGMWIYKGSDGLNNSSEI